jgi:hypothetical protein
VHLKLQGKNITPWLLEVNVYVGDQLKTWTVLKLSNGFKAGWTVSKWAQRFLNRLDGCEAVVMVLQLVKNITNS